MAEHTPVRRTVAVAVAALVVAGAAAAVGRMASGSLRPAAPAAPVHAAPPGAATSETPDGVPESVQRIREAKVQAELRKVLDPGAPGAAEPEGDADPRLAPLLARLKANPDDVDALLSAGYVYVQHHAYDKARGYYLHAAQVAPDNVEARTHLGTVAYFLGNLDEALHHYEQALALNPDYAPAYFEMGAALRFGRHDLAGAVKAWERFLELDPGAAEAGRIRELVAETKRMLAEGTAPAPGTPGQGHAAPLDPSTAPWPGGKGPDRSQGAPPAGAPGGKAG